MKSTPMDHLKSRLLMTAAGFFALIVIGTTGYQVLEGQNVADALYMTIITLTAVGYREVFPLSPEGRAFTIFVLLAGISWLGLWFASITSLIVDLDLKDAIRRRRAMQDIANMKDHIIVCGAGRTGRQVAQELDPVTQNYIVIESDPKQVEALKEYVPKAQVIEGDATHDHVLLEAGLMRAKGLISCLSADADNLYVCLSARELATSVTIVARAYEEESVAKLYRAGANHVVSPNVSSAIRMASVLLRPSVVSFLDVATRSSKLALRMEQAIVGEGSVIAGSTLEEAQILQETGLIVIAMRKRGSDESDFVFNPSTATSVESGDEVIVLGESDQIERLKAYLN
ncbi:MAG: potassium channel protein [Gemmatimonadetes bacterium]|nr:potassium channel protein [Gemmatimonadota bacterium]